MLAELNRLIGAAAGVALVAGPIDDAAFVTPLEFTPVEEEDVGRVVSALVSCASVVGSGGGTAGDADADADDDGALSASMLVLIPFKFCVDDSPETCSISLICNSAPVLPSRVTLNG